MAHVKDNRYVMGYSQAEHGNMVVYAPTYEEAVARWENGEYTIEDTDAMADMSEEDYDEYMSRLIS